nr:hypothetical protein [Tanacetum cinerariifolium]
EHSKVLELEAEVLKRQHMLTDLKTKDQLQGKDETIRNLQVQHDINDGYKVTNANLNKCYRELSKANTHLRTTSLEKIATQKAKIATLKAEAVGKKNSGPTGTPTKPKVLASGMYTKSSKSTQKPPVQHKKPTIPMNMFLKAKPATEGRKPIPKRNTQNHNPLPAKSVKARRAADYYRNLYIDISQFVDRSTKSVHTKSHQAKRVVNTSTNSWNATKNTVARIVPIWKPTEIYKGYCTRISSIKDARYPIGTSLAIAESIVREPRDHSDCRTCTRTNTWGKFYRLENGFQTQSSISTRTNAWFEF